MKPVAKLGVAILLLSIAAGAAHKSTKKPAPSPIDGPAMFVNGSTAQEWFEACQKERQENERLQSALKAEKATSLAWYKLSPQYAKKIAAKQVSGHYERRCNGDSCTLVWVADKPAAPAKAAAKSTKPVATVKPQVTYRQRGTRLGWFR